MAQENAPGESDTIEARSPPLLATAPLGPDWRWRSGATGGFFHFWREAWDRRDLGWLLAQRDLQIRYRQAAIGTLWAIIQPLAQLVIFLIFFGLLEKRPADETIPYWLVVFSGLLPWQFFSYVVQQGAGSLVVNQALIGKASFPRQLLPLSTLLTASVDFGIVSVVFVAGLAFHGLLSPALLLAPFFLAIVAVTAIALGIGLAALNALYRDVGQMVPLMMQVLFYATPVFYQVHALAGGRYASYWSCNPLAAGIEGFRWTCLGAQRPVSSLLIGGPLVACGLLLVAVRYFQSVNRVMADRI